MQLPASLMKWAIPGPSGATRGTPKLGPTRLAMALPRWLGPLVGTGGNPGMSVSLTRPAIESEGDRMVWGSAHFGVVSLTSECFPVRRI